MYNKGSFAYKDIIGLELNLIHLLLVFDPMEEGKQGRSNTVTKLWSML